MRAQPAEGNNVATISQALCLGKHITQALGQAGLLCNALYSDPPTAQLPKRLAKLRWQSTYRGTCPSDRTCTVVSAFAVQRCRIRLRPPAMDVNSCAHADRLAPRSHLRSKHSFELLQWLSEHCQPHLLLGEVGHRHGFTTVILPPPCLDKTTFHSHVSYPACRLPFFRRRARGGAARPARRRGLGCFVCGHGATVA